MTTRGEAVLVGTSPTLTKEVGVLAAGYAVVPHVIVALDQGRDTAWPWLSGLLEPTLLLVGIGALWPVALAARHGEWFGALGSGWLVGMAAVAFVPILCNFAPWGKPRARPEPRPLQGGCIPAEGLAAYLAGALGVGLVLFAANYVHWRRSVESAST